MLSIEKQKEIILDIAFEVAESWMWNCVDSFGDSEAIIGSDIMVRLSDECAKLNKMEEEF
ncbi:MAG: hypothetical protein GY710_02170 [Desulfobacteraceae bacterium]|nr:hypothetical protein [Desulfobacteraceae bacterium]